MTLISAQNAALKPRKAKSAKAVYPSDELRDAFYSVGIELEKAFNIAARETHSAIQKAKENWQQKPPQQSETVTCTNAPQKILMAQFSVIAAAQNLHRMKSHTVVLKKWMQTRLL